MQVIATDNKKIVIGLGMTGLSCARFFAAKHQPFSVVDSRTNPPGLEQFKEEFPEVAIALGEISDDMLAGASQLVVSPGVSLEEPAIKHAIEDGVAVCGDIDLFRREVSAPIIAITGSNGKSTVTTLVGEMARSCGRQVAVGGNIGVPALDLLNEEDPDLFVLELSSFQLERAGDLSFDVATVLNVSADHMDRYPNLVAYHQAKHRIFRGCKKVVVNRGDALSMPLLAEGVEVWTFGLDKPDFRGFGIIVEDDIEYLAFEFEPLMSVAELKIVGRHNIENALAALALGKAAGFALAPMLEVLRSFTGLPHRCQYVAEKNGVRFYNDSKGTNVGATVAAIKGLVSEAVKLVLIAGGESKDADFAPLIPVLEQHCRAVVLIGEAAEELFGLCSGRVQAVRAGAMSEAVSVAATLAIDGDVVLLSPACASFDMFDNYMHRGNVFAEAVMQWLERQQG